MDEHISLYNNYTPSNFKCCQVGFLIVREKCWIWIYASISLAGPEILLNKISPS